MMRGRRRARRARPPRRTPSPSATAPAPRTTRAMYVQPSAASTRMIDVRAVPEVLDARPRAARGRGGSRKRSVTRSAAGRSQPPKYAGDRADRRRRRPSRATRRRGRSSSEICPAYMISAELVAAEVVGAEPVLRRSGPRSPSSRFCAFCVYGASHGAPKHATIRISEHRDRDQRPAGAGRSAAGRAASCVRATGSAPGARSSGRRSAAVRARRCDAHDSRIRGSSTTYRTSASRLNTITATALTKNHASRNGASPAPSAVRKRLTHARDREDLLGDDHAADRGTRCRARSPSRTGSARCGARA